MPMVHQQFRNLPSSLQNAVTGLLFRDEGWDDELLAMKLQTTQCRKLVDNLARKEIEPSDYMAMWEATLDRFNSQDPIVEQDWWSVGACDLRDTIAEVTETFDGLYDFFGLELKDNVAFDWGWAPTLIDTLTNRRQTLRHTPQIPWFERLVIGLMTTLQCNNTPTDLESFDAEGWHYGPRRMNDGCVEACPREQAHFWGVYGQDVSGYAQHLADCHVEQDAQLLKSALQIVYRIPYIH